MKYLSICIAALVLLLAGCTTPQSKATADEAAVPTLTVTIEPQRALVEAVAGNRFRVVSMVPKGSSPETYDPTPQQLVRLGQSRAYLRIGYLGFEVAWMDKLRQNAPDMALFNLSLGIAPIYESHADEAHASVHAAGIEPHIWMSAKNAQVIADNICHALTTLDAAHAEEFARRTDSLKLVIHRTDSVVRSLLPQPLHGIPHLSSLAQLFRPRLRPAANQHRGRRQGALARPPEGVDPEEPCLAPQSHLRAARV